MYASLDGSASEARGNVSEHSVCNSGARDLSTHSARLSDRERKRKMLKLEVNRRKYLGLRRKWKPSTTPIVGHLVHHRTPLQSPGAGKAPSTPRSGDALSRGILRLSNKPIHVISNLVTDIIWTTLEDWAPYKKKLAGHPRFSYSSPDGPHSPLARP
jgi:hypothetical protein